MLKVGITGQSGFIGSHLFNYLNLQKEKIKTIPFEDEFFNNEDTLAEWAGKCDTIVHLAALNRHNDADVIYKTNLMLVSRLISAAEKSGKRHHILFSSSTQEERDNPYGNSKKEGRQMLQEWAQRTGGIFTGFVIPNVFGPFGDPYYNSVVATFSHQLTHGENPEIHVDGELKLIYVQELVEVMYGAILARESKNPYRVDHTSVSKVSRILELLNRYKTEYIENNIIPGFENSFEKNLFNTFRCYIDIKNHNPVTLKQNTDNRGSFVETIKTQLGGQFSFSTTVPGITRGNHFHTRKIERFIVIKGEAIIRLRRIGTDKVMEFKLTGDNPAFVDMPVWYTHNITNTGKEELYTLFWINEFFDPNDPDTFYEEVEIE